VTRAEFIRRRAATWAAPLLFVAAEPARARDLVLDAGAPFIDAEINGVRLRLKTDFDHSLTIRLNPEAAARARLGRGKGSWTEIVGPIRLRGRTITIPAAIAGTSVQSEVNWNDRQASRDADGTISPHLLPYDNVTIQRRRPVAGEQLVSLPAALHDNHGLHMPLRLGERRIALRFSLVRQRSIATAAAAAVIAKHHGGMLGESKSSEEIVFGVARPVRPLTLDRPILLGPLEVRVLMARPADYRGKHDLPAIADVRAREGIVVTGRRPSQDPMYRVTLGLDVLGRCSAVTYRRAERQLRLRCAGA
jgi:hypothetical protein